MNSSGNSRLAVVAEREVQNPMTPEMQRLTESLRTPLQSSTSDQRSENEQQVDPNSNHSKNEFVTRMLAVFQVLAMVLSARFLLLGAGVGALLLGYLSLQNPSVLTLTTAATYDTLIFIPLVYLYLKKG